jgi:lauroyl/myristoyl acyltransferase
MSRWKAFRYRLEEAGCRLLAWFIPLLSRRACVRLAHAVGALAYLVDRRGRATALANLHAAFGDRFSPSERVRIARASFQNFARTMLDLFWVTRLNAQNYTEWIEMSGLEAVHERMVKERRGAVYSCSHFGNWEWANQGGAFAGTKAHTVAENFKNPRLTAVFKALREHSGATLIPQENSLLRLMKVVKRGSPASLMVDLNLPPTQAATIIETFRSTSANGVGLKMCVSILHAVLAQRAGALLAPVETQPKADGGCRVIVHPPIDVQPEDSLADLAQKCWDAFEPFISARPELYLWPYKHFRYRPKDATRDYPFYANTNGKFEKLLKEAREAKGSSRRVPPSL